MSSFTCLRDNFTFDRFHYEGRVYEFPDEVAVKYPKNFKLVEVPATTTESLSNLAMESPLAEPATPKVRKVHVRKGGLHRVKRSLTSHKEKEDVSTH